MNLFARSARSLQEKGWRRSWQSVTSVIGDYFFDLIYGTDTAGWVTVDALDITDEDKKHSVRYQPTRVRHVRKLLSELSLPPGRVFVDFGCGKGRVLMVASCYPFQRIVGVEISGRLCDVARRNVLIYQKRAHRQLPRRHRTLRCRPVPDTARGGRFLLLQAF